MAARKSCTHLTWSEAKARSGVGTTKSKAFNKVAKGETHGKLLANKIMAKHGPDPKEQVQNCQAAKQARKDQLRAAQLDAKRQEEKELARLQNVVQPWKQAHENVYQTAMELEAKGAVVPMKMDDKPSSDQFELACESKQMQYDEWMALRAIYHDGEIIEDEGDDDDDGTTAKLRLVAGSCTINQLESCLEEWQQDTDNPSLQQALVDLPPFSFTLALEFFLEDNDNDNDNHDPPMSAACLLLQVTCSSLYPEATIPEFSIPYYYFTNDPTLSVPSNKPLTSVARLQSTKLLQDMRIYIQEELIGMPCVYEVASTWLSEHIWEYTE